MGSSGEGQTYCLRWNNHKSNLVEILDALIKMESYVDCTIVVDEQVQFKAHRVVLAANSPYFQSILQDVPMDHCSILFPGVQAFEMRALLEYMYTGEVNVTESQIPRIMKIAEQLEVKGLFDMTDLKEKFTKYEDNGPFNHSSSSSTSPYGIPFPPSLPLTQQSTGGVAAIAAAAGLTTSTFRENSKDINRDINERDNHLHYSHSHSLQSHHRSSSSINLDHRNNHERRLSSSERRLSVDRDRDRELRERSGHRALSSTSTGLATITDLHHQHQQQQSSPVITTSSSITQHQAQSSSSPPPSYLYKSPYSSLYTKSPGPSESRRSTEDRNERYNSSNDRLERQERGLHNERGNERLHDRHLIQQRQITPPPPPIPTATTQHAPWPISSVMSSASIPTTAAAAAMLSSVYESAPDMNPLKRKKLSSISSMLMGSDTPILRNVLAQSHAADSSQSIPLVKQERENEKQGPLNCSGPSDYNNDKYGKYDEPHSPFIDKFEDEGMDCSSNERLGNLFYSSNNNSQKPEWKRYKQYTRSNILAAIECVRNGLSVLKTSRKFGVPSRTLYDKVKKLGITTVRPINRTVRRNPSTGSSSASFPMGISGTTHSAYSQAEAMLSQVHESNDLHSSHLRSNSNGSNGNGNIDKEHRGEHHLPPNLPHPAAAALLDPAFLQQAFESRGGDIAGRDALHAMALAAAAHAAVNGISTSPGTNGTARSPSPGYVLKYSRSHHGSPPPSSTTTMNLNRTSSSTSSSQHHQLTVPQDSNYQLHLSDRDRERDRDYKMEYERDHDDDDNDDNENSRSSVRDQSLRSDDNDISDHREHELMQRGIRNKYYRKRNIIKNENEQDKVEDLSVNRKETITQQNINSISPQPISPSSSSHPPHSSSPVPLPPPPSSSLSSALPLSLSISNNDNHHHNKNSSSYGNSNSGIQGSGGVIMPPIITKLSPKYINETTTATTTTDYSINLETTTTTTTQSSSSAAAAAAPTKRELIADENRD